MKQNMDNSQGMSLLEVVFSLIIFSIGMWGVLGMYALGEEGVKYGNKATLALNAAQQKMEEIVALSEEAFFWDDRDGDAVSETRMSNIGSGVFSGEDEPWPGILRRWSIQPTQSGLTLISVLTVWKNKKQKEKKIELRRFQMKFSE